MFRSKKDIDRHVQDLEDKFRDHTERYLKYNTVAKLYFNLGEVDLALKYLDKFLEVRGTSAHAFKFRGQILEKSLEKSTIQENPEALYSKRQAALEAFKTSFDLDQSQKEVLLKICNLYHQLPIDNIDIVQRWADRGEKHFPRNPSVKKLREKMRSVREDNGANMNGNGHQSTDGSPSSHAGDDVEADNSILWSTSRLGNSFALNGSYRLEDALNSTPGRAAGGARRFPPRPSPERLANQVRQVESAQEKIVSAISENNRASLETQEAILGELRKTREDVTRNFRENTEAVRDLRGELSSMWREMREELRRIASKKQEVVVVKEESKPTIPTAASSKPDLPDWQEVLAQQAVMSQMYSMGAMLASRPPVPIPGLPPQMYPLPQAGAPVTPQIMPTAATAPMTNTPSPSNVVITASEKIPAVVSSAPVATLPAVSIPPQHRLGGNQITKATASLNATAKEGPAIPISTSSILANIPPPVISAVSAPKPSISQPAPPLTSKPSASTAVAAQAPKPAPSGGNSLFDKFKPKAGSWECKGCFLRQNPEVIQCPACQAIKPGHEDEVKAKEEETKPTVSMGAEGGFKFSFGATTEKPQNSSGFTFSNTPVVAKDKTPAPEQPAKSSPFSGFSFGSGGGGAAAAFSTVGPTSTSTPSSSFSFAGIQAVQSPTKANTPKDADDNEEAGHDDSANHDPHFEPIIPLPELVQVTTGEEEEEVTFKHRAKVFRFDKEAKQWKERGVGDIKILHHKEKNTFRILLRRDQVHKIACNHYINVNQVLEPMPSCETALMWFALDYSEDEVNGLPEKLAVKFKLAETKDEFKKVFEDSQRMIENGASNMKAAASVASPSSSELSFEGQGLKLNNANDAKDVVAKIKATKNITTLTFSGNTVGIDAAQVIGQALEEHSELKYAHWKDMFTGRMKTEIPPALKHLSKGLMTANVRLVELDLSDNAFGPIGMEGIVDLLKSPSCFTLQELKLNNTGCGVTGGKLLAKTLMECYKLSGGKLALRKFILGRSRQENAGATALAEVFKAMGSLEEVVMPQNGIYFEGITALADAFAHSPNLRHLNMNDNTFTEKGAKALADALPKLQKLEILNLGDCLLKTEGARLISYALKEGHPNLKEWYMDSNEIRLAGGFAIVDAVANKDNMEILTLDANQFGAEGCGKIMRKLENAGKRELIDEIEEDEDPEDSEEEENEEDEDDDDDADETPVVQNITSFSFGTTPNTPQSIFGGASAQVTTPKSIFGSSPSVVGKSETSGSSSIFSGLQLGSGGSGTSTNLFGGATSGSTSTTTPSLFGGSSATTGATSIFGGKSQVSGSAGVDLSASKDLPSFGSLGGSSGGFSFGQKTEGFSFAGAGASVFGSANAATGASPGKANADANESAEDPEHDPHFEPVVPLPELVQVTTGEEDEEVTFKHRAKVFRFDKEAKQWKERGVGDIKILHHKEKNTFRILLRRDQVHKIACNHYINVNQVLEPMPSCETALMWFAMDYSEDEANGLPEKLAVKFKLAETKDEFKRVFEDSQSRIGNEPAAAAPVVDRARPARNDENEEEDDDYDDDDETGDDQSDDTNNTMFERECDLRELTDDGKEASLGRVYLRILYDEDVYGARIVASKFSEEANGEMNEDEVYLCNHLIAMQTNLDVDEEKKKCSWSGLDFSVDPPRYRKFLATFFEESDAGDDAQMEFVSIFQEGKELADQSEILEQPAAGGSLNPETLYYGQGADE